MGGVSCCKAAALLALVVLAPLTARSHAARSSFGVMHGLAPVKLSLSPVAAAAAALPVMAAEAERIAGGDDHVLLRRRVLQEGGGRGEEGYPWHPPTTPGNSPANGHGRNPPTN
ncbi:hypothetical protein ABZP36_000399 [Zizania latifolia]